MATNNAGKGDSPRNIFSKDFRDNYDCIDWGKPKIKKSLLKEIFNEIYEFEESEDYKQSLKDSKD